MLDLAALQALIAVGELDANSVWPATRRCRNCLEDYQWTYDDVLRMISCLESCDHKNSEWCGIDGNRAVPCDVYTIRYDDSRHQRSPRGLEVYLKFSVEDNGTVTLVLVQSHL